MSRIATPVWKTIPARPPRRDGLGLLVAGVTLVLALTLAAGAASGAWESVLPAFHALNLSGFATCL